MRSDSARDSIRAVAHPPADPPADTFVLVSVGGRPVPASMTAVPSCPGEYILWSQYVLRADSTYDVASAMKKGCGDSTSASDTVRHHGNYSVHGDELIASVGDGDEEFQDFLARYSLDSLVEKYRDTVSTRRYARRHPETGRK
jgi:hypothetical protein